MDELYQKIVSHIRSLMARILEPRLDLDEFLADVARSAKQLAPEHLEARVYEVDFIENLLYLRTSTQINAADLPRQHKAYTILPKTITGDAIIENRVIMATREEGYQHSRFQEGEETRAAFPIEFHDMDLPEGRTKYVLVVDQKGGGPLEPEVMEALRDFSLLAGLAISLKEFRDKLSQYYDRTRNLVLTGQHSVGIAHDIRSLNVGVGGFLNMALRRMGKSGPRDLIEDIQAPLTMALDSSRQIEALLENVSEFSRTQLYLNRDTDLTEALQSKVDNLRHRADYGRLVRFDLKLPAGPTGFLVDRDWFGTVIENLVKNSVEACRKTTRISIAVDMRADAAVVTLEDDCGGIPPELMPEIFTPFRSGKARSQGLGLANAKKVVEEHGGTIAARNNGDRGAVFTLLFPLPPSES
ncbi:MAG: HAMP domain-containing histidine kinase [Proteobacteria bacterium]|nr:HAMP domain-containing histidine kinase [Pseudomonadota bacterium]